MPTTSPSPLANPVQPVPPLPTSAAQISGKRYSFADNSLGWNSLTLTFSPCSTPAHAAVSTTEGVISMEIGVNNIYRLNLQPDGSHVALQGRWAGDHTFVVYELVIDGINEYDTHLNFSGNLVAVHVEETVFGQLTNDFTGTSP